MIQLLFHHIYDLSLFGLLRGYRAYPQLLLLFFLYYPLRFLMRFTELFGCQL